MVRERERERERERQRRNKPWKKKNLIDLVFTRHKKGFNLVFGKNKIHLIGHHFQLSTNLGF